MALSLSHRSARPFDLHAQRNLLKDSIFAFRQCMYICIHLSVLSCDDIGLGISGIIVYWLYKSYVIRLNVIYICVQKCRCMHCLIYDV